jgi:hypothetical protein
VREARALARAWKEDYNRHRPHSALGYRTPAQYAAACLRTDTHRQATAWAAPGLSASGGLALAHPTPLAGETLITPGTKNGGTSH